MEGVDLGVAGALAEGGAASPAITSQRIRVVRCQLRGGGGALVRASVFARIIWWYSARGCAQPDVVNGGGPSRRHSRSRSRSRSVGGDAPQCDEHLDGVRDCQRSGAGPYRQAYY